MPLATCPLCGSDVKVQSKTPHLPLLCRKCHSPFHLGRDGTSVLGRPPDVEREVEELKQLVREKARELPVKKIVAALGALLVFGMGLSYFFRANDALEPTAKTAAQAFADNDLETLKSMAASGTTEELVRWYDETHPTLVHQRVSWNGKAEAVEVGIAAEDATKRHGATAFSVHPGMGNARDVSIAAPGEATAGALSSFDSSLEWTLSGGGHWLIDGHLTYTKLHPPGSSSIGSAQASAATTTR